jgi:ABC-2 type transport system permease protein
MIALLQAELIKLRTTRTFAAIVGTAAATSVIVVALGAALGVETDPQALFTNTSITYIIVLLGAIGMTGEWRHRTITSSILAAPDRVRLLVAKTLSISAAGVALSLVVTVATMVVGELILSSRGEATLGAGGLADVLWRNLAVAALLGPFGVCVGALLRNQIATVVGLVIVAAVVEPAVVQAVPEVGRFGPLAGAPDGILGGADAAATGVLAPGPAIAVVVAWTLAAFIAAAIRLRNRDLV